MVSFRDIEDVTQVEAYEAKLSKGYGERPVLIEQILVQLQMNLPQQPLLAELCIGPGVLTQRICEQIPDICYVGLDFKAPFLEYTARRLPAGTRASLLLADLSGETWPDALLQANAGQPFDAIISMQSLHDVGGAASTANIYRHCWQLLRPGGMMLNADLVIPAGMEAVPNPRRLTVKHHLQLFAEAGYQRSECTLEQGEFACCLGWR